MDTSATSSFSSAGAQKLSSPDTRFEYQDLSPSVAKFLRGQAERIRRQCASSIIQVGKALIESKRHLSHGAFLQWVECEVGIPARTAQAYMRVASWAAGKSATVAHLPSTVLYILSANGVPEEFVVDVLERVGAGEHVAPSAMREELKAFQVRKRNGSSSMECSTSQLSSRALTQQECADAGTLAPTAIGELASFLVQRLSTDDLTRLCDLLACDYVRSDAKLAESLEQQFRSALDGRENAITAPVETTTKLSRVRRLVR